MTTFSKTGFKTLNYNSFRPKYPQSFYKILVDYANSEPGFKFGRTLDVGCGTGIATYDMLNFSEKVVGMDLSPSMIDTCNSLIKDRSESLGISDTSRISFTVGDLDDLTKFNGEGYDLIVAAQCLHWTKDFNKLFANIHKLLNPGGVFAYWYYVDPIPVDFKPSEGDKKPALKAANSVYLNYMYDDPKLVGPYWEQPGRNIIRDGYKDINDKIPKKDFTDIVINKYSVDVDNYSPPDETKHLTLSRDNITIKDSLNYLSTYSGLHNYLEAHPDSTIIEQYTKELKDKTGWTEKTTFDSIWNTGYTFIRKA